MSVDFWLKNPRPSAIEKLDEELAAVIPKRQRPAFHERPRHDTIKVPVAPDTPPRPAPRPVPETDRHWRPSHFPF